MTDFVPTKTEFITKAWMFNVLNSSREAKQQSLLRYTLEYIYFIVKKRWRFFFVMKYRGKSDKNITDLMKGAFNFPFN